MSAWRSNSGSPPARGSRPTTNQPLETTQLAEPHGQELIAALLEEHRGAPRTDARIILSHFVNC